MTRSAIVSRLPGRLRVRDPGLRQPQRNEALRTELADWTGVVSVEGNPTAGSILLCYDVSRVSPSEMEARMIQRLEILRGGSVASEVKPEGAGSDPSESGLGENGFGATLWRMNRAAKIGMLGSLAATLLALSVGKRLHATAGTAYLAFLLVHLANHRNKLLK